MTNQPLHITSPMTFHQHFVQIYYEDTDHSGVVYHANYLKYFERAREQMLGVEKLVQLGQSGIGFVVYQAQLKYLKGAQFGDKIVIKSTAKKESAYRLIFQQDALLNEDVLVQAEIQLACVNEHKHLTALPTVVLAELSSKKFYLFS